MIIEIDKLLHQAFTPERVANAFYDYKLAKWNRFSGLDDSAEISVPLGVDGVTWEAFEKQLWRNARNISYRVRQGTYTFHPFREIDKKKDPAGSWTDDNIRRLGVASVRDALVQTVLYHDVLDTLAEPLFRTQDTAGPVSFAYRKGKSTAGAARLIHRYLQEGYVFAYDADLSKYFDTISHDILLEKVAHLIGGSQSNTYRLIRRFVRTDRTPHCSYRNARHQGKLVGENVFKWAKPVRCRRTAGVPQGGVLSGMLANLYLHDFDRWVITELAESIDLRYVRYADDFIILAQNPESLAQAKREAVQKLESAEFRLIINEGKSKDFDVRERDLEFIGFRFDTAHIRVRDKSLNKFKSKFRQDVFGGLPQDYKERGIAYTLKHLIRAANYKVLGVLGHDVCPVCRCERVGSPRSWMAAFRAVTDDNQLRDLDKWIRKSMYDWIFREFHERIPRSKLRCLRIRGRSGVKCYHLKSLVDELHHVHRARRQPCLCEILDKGLWKFAANNYQGRKLQTLDQRKPFGVPFVDEAGLQVSVGNKQYRIERGLVENIWERLVDGQKVTRVSLEKVGIRNTSQIVALLAELPSVYVTYHPITLELRKQPVAAFLVRPEEPV